MTGENAAPGRDTAPGENARAGHESGEKAEAGAGLELTPDEADVVAGVAGDYAAVLPPDRAALYRELAEAAAGGHIPDDLVDALQRVAAVGLQTGRTRQDGQVGAERILAAVYRRTPAGQVLAGRTQEVNEALRALAGRRLASAHTTALAHGRYTITLQTDGATVTLSVDSAGIGVRSLQVG